MGEYAIKFFYHPDSDKAPVLEYLEDLPVKEKIKVTKYIEFLRQNKGVLDEPYTKHIRGKIRELRVDFGKNRHRVFFFTFIGKTIILLHAFQKRSAKTPQTHIDQAMLNYSMVINNPRLYEK